MDVPAMRIALDTCKERFGFYGLSFWGDDGLSVDEIAALARLPNARIRVSTVGRLRALGLELSRFGRYPHLTLRFEISPTDEELAELAKTFDSDIPNPAVDG